MVSGFNVLNKERSIGMDWIKKARNYFSVILKNLPFDMTGSTTESVVDSIYTELKKLLQIRRIDESLEYFDNLDKLNGKCIID